MKNLLQNYIKLLKFNGSYKTLAIIMFIIFPTILIVLNIDDSFYLTMFPLVYSYTIFPLILDKFSGEKYILLSMLPIKTKDIIKLIYLHTYIILGTSIITIFIMNLINPSKNSLLYLVYITFYLILSNIFYPYFASTELKYVSKITTWTLWSGLSIIILGILMRNIFDSMDSTSVFYIKLSMIMLNIFIAAFTLKKSYRTTLKKVMCFNT